MAKKKLFMCIIFFAQDGVYLVLLGTDIKGTLTELFRKLNNDASFINKRVQLFIHETMSLKWVEKKKILGHHSLLLTKFSIFLKSTCLLLAIFLKFIFNQKEKRGFIWPETFNFLFQKPYFYSEKKREITFNFRKWTWTFWQAFFCIFLLFRNICLKGTPLSGCFHLFQ